jgi:DNA gyrase subunit A
VEDDDEVMLISDQGNIIRMLVGDIRIIGRNTQGVRLHDLAEGERLVAAAKLAEAEAEVEAEVEGDNGNGEEPGEDEGAEPAGEEESVD